jgi:hypothetical protein
VAPTLLKAAGCEVPDAMMGIDLAQPGAGRDRIFAENWGGQEYMVRTETHKLLWCKDPARSQFFDLKHDPLELDNRIDDPIYAETITMLREALARWALFEARTRVYRDDDAPRIEGANVPTPDDDHVQAMIEYFEEKMGAS